jgi:hypothetical protein
MSIFKNLFSKKEESPKQEVIQQPETKPVNKDAEISIAIAAAIYLYRQEVHDYEDTVLTIKRIDRAYSPWSSKIYSLRKYPRQI